MAPNVLLVVLDAARRDAVEPYAAAAETPAIADLSRRGRALPNAYAAANWTIPSHAAMFTGQLPRQAGLSQVPGATPAGVRGVLETQTDRLLPEMLRRAGYRTRGLSSNLWVSHHSGFDLGFDDFGYFPTQRLKDADEMRGAGWRETLAWVREGLRAEADDGAAAVGEALTASIEDWSGDPTFWFVNLVECHSPYLPPRPWNDLPPWGRAQAALDSKRYHSLVNIMLYVGGALDIPDAAFERMHHLYRRAIGYMDHWLAGILEALDRRGILDETLVIVTSDHGEHFGDGRLFGHGFSLDQTLINVPLVMAGPGAVETDAAFSLVELPRLIAAAAGIDEHPWERVTPDGVAIAQYDPMPRDALEGFAAEQGLPKEGLDRLSPVIRCATDGRLKLVVRNGEELAYDLEADPGESRPLAEPGSDVERLRAALADADRGAPATPAVAATTAPASDEEVAEIEQQMKLLGYM